MKLKKIEQIIKAAKHILRSGKVYPYHNEIKKRIRNGELIGFEYVDNYKNIGECLLLLFSTPPFERPIRPHKYHDYDAILAEWKKSKE